MSDQPQSGYVLPEGFTVISAVFDRVVDAKHIARHSDEAERLARQALSLYMSGTRDAWALELRLQQSSHFIDYSPSKISNTQVVDVLPELSAWARRLTVSPEAATALTEQTLQCAVDHFDEFIEVEDVRGWLVRLMVELRLGRGPRRRRS